MDVSSSKPLDLEPSKVVSNKIHVRGVDDLTTTDVLNYIESYQPSIEPLPQVEWIDDTSANIMFEVAEVAETVLRTLSEDSSAQLSRFQLRNAKICLAHPEINLQVRIAVLTDRKQPRAYESSRFYMMHPEHDPRQRRRSERRSSFPRTMRHGDQEHRRERRKGKRQGLSASMYDDSESPKDSRRNSVSSYSSSASRSRQGFRFADRGVPRRPRDRSASPTQRDDHIVYCPRNRTPPPRYRKRDPNPFPAANNGKELFPAKTTSSSLGERIAAQSSSVQGKESLINKSKAANMKKELFPLKSGVNGHRRSLAFDAADETADLFATGMTVPFTDGSVDQRGSSKGSLADRITTRHATHSTPKKPIDKGSDFSIHGAATKPHDVGFSIRGLAADGPDSSGARAKELFSSKLGAGNQGKELFAAKVAGSARRKRAVDMFAD